jgi:hypothetical protein
MAFSRQGQAQQQPQGGLWTSWSPIEHQKAEVFNPEALDQPVPSRMVGTLDCALGLMAGTLGFADLLMAGAQPRMPSLEKSFGIRIPMNRQATPKYVEVRHVRTKEAKLRALWPMALQPRFFYLESCLVPSFTVAILAQGTEWAVATTAGHFPGFKSPSGTLGGSSLVGCIHFGCLENTLKQW